MNPVGIPCNACENHHCLQCVGDLMEVRNWIESAKDHCSCASKGHDPNSKPMVVRKVKSMFSKIKDTDGPAVDPELVDEVEVD